jgi:hypothetical protein
LARRLFGIHGLGVQNFDPKVVDRPAVSWILDQHQLERGLCDREVGVARTSFGGLDAKQFGVEGDRRVDIVDIVDIEG